MLARGKNTNAHSRDLLVNESTGLRGSVRTRMESRYKHERGCQKGRENEKVKSSKRGRTLCGRIRRKSVTGREREI